jgi:preprotein translocase subunit SecD
MNRYPLWKNATVLIALVLGLLYTLPNFFGEAPAVQVASVKSTHKVDAKLLAQVEAALKAASIAPQGVVLDLNSVRVRLADTDTQLKARDVIEKAVNPLAVDATYSVALNLVSDSPNWLTGIHALPMYLGLDLRGGVHFLLQVDMKGALTKRLDSIGADLRSLMRDKNIRHGGVGREGQTVAIRFREADVREKARAVLADSQPDLLLVDAQDGSDLKLVATLKPEAQKRIQEFAVKQNITTLHNRINELGVAEPVIQQQGADRIVVQLPGVQDTAKAKDILGRTATLEVRLVDDEASANPGIMEQAAAGQPPVGTEYYVERGGRGLLVKKQVVLTGERLTDAQPGFDNQTQEAAVHLSLDSAGARMSTVEANDVALLLRAGSLAAPMEIIEERTIGPSLGADNIAKGFSSTLWGFIAISVFMTSYYLLFGAVSVFALSANLLFLVALLSLLQATLTLPGIAAIALTLGMAIDANVLINERVREELRAGNSAQASITAGYERAWATILDSNITTLIAGVALLIFGSGPVRGFAVVHCLGILTSIFSSVVVSRAVINLIYGHRRKLGSVSIGQIWKPGV